MGVTVCPNGMFIPIRSGQVCPVCGSKKGRCAVFVDQNGEPVFYRCKYKESLKPSYGWFIHPATDKIASVHNTHYDLKIAPKSVTKDSINIRDRVYKELLSLCSLDEMTKKNLLDRGLTEEQIIRHSYKSVPSPGDKIRIAKQLYDKFGSDLFTVPGFEIRKSKTGNEYPVVKGGRGFYIPYKNIEGKIVGIQIRLAEPIVVDNKPLRYYWLSSTQACSGSPAHYYCPAHPAADNIIIFIEGALKGNIVAEKMQLPVMAVAGVSNYRRLIKNLQLLEKETGRKYTVFTAYDMDKYEKEEVKNAEMALLSLLVATKHEFFIMQWDKKAKGLDDALMAGLDIKMISM